MTGLLLAFVPFANKLDDNPIQSLSSYLTGFMPFFFAMYLNVVFSRWWTMRTSGIGAMWQAVDDLCVMLATHCRGSIFEGRRDAMLRYGLLSQALIYHAARGHTDLKPLVSDGLLNVSEFQTLKDITASNPQAIWVWILDFCVELHQ